LNLPSGRGASHINAFEESDHDKNPSVEDLEEEDDIEVPPKFLKGA
jgi:hypothetical protein